MENSITSVQKEITLSVLTKTRETHGRRVEIEKGVMSLNNQYAAKNRELLSGFGIKTLNVLSSPGSGKTTLLAKTFQDISQQIEMAVIVGDLATAADATKLRESGANAVQIETGTLCHLEAAMIAHALDSLELKNLELLFVENVGNLVCPAAYDLGEDARVVLFCVTEGEDKPLKYPKIFKSANLVLLTKIDLLEVTGFDLQLARKNLALVTPAATILEVSARNEQGLGDWYAYLKSLR